jgi:uncharacterized membrane protein HdeD (DUF308 family)
MEAGMAVADLKKRMGLVMGVRALLMLLAGLYAVIWPAQALFILVWAGAILLVVDGALGLWALTFGGAKTGNYWFDVIRNVLAIITGVLILLSPILGALITVWFVVYLLAFQAILVGVMEIVIVLRERALYSKIWPVLVSGILYVLFGISLLFAPLMGAILLTVLGGVLMILFSVALGALAWRMWQGGAAAASAG